MEKEHVLVAMSGGVDSSVTALLLKKKGYKVTGITFKMLPENSHPMVVTQIRDAREVSRILDIEHITVDIAEEFEKSIIDYFAGEYLRGRTPNPCVLCNRIIKFKHLLKVAGKIDANFIATGHYATVYRDTESGIYYLKTAKNKFRDQSYFLYRIDQIVLSKVLFPLGEYDKDSVRKIAKENNIHVHNKGDSHEICFITGKDYRSFFKERNIPFAQSHGKIIYRDGTVLGYHNGIVNYTIGQRRGLGISHHTPLYVLRIDSKTNTVVVGDREDLMHRKLTASDLHWINKKPEVGLTVLAKIRSIHIPARAKITGLNNDRLEILFDEPQWAVTPGQSVVLYKEDTVLGGGIILNGE